MAELRWTKLQDFCLRLGLLKALVAVLPRQRQPLPREELIRRVQRTLFGVRGPSSIRTRSGPASPAGVSRADRLLRESASYSWGQPIHASTAYKILEWGLTTRLVVAGNRISERGLLLRSLIGEPNVESFVKEKETWNPFDISPAERAFFLYHLGGLDELLVQIVIDAGSRGAGTVCDAGVAYRLVADGMHAVLARAEHGLELQDRARFATVRELSGMIDWEIAEDRSASRPRSRTSKASTVRRRSGSAAGTRVTKKSADHQAIPRCEQLVDLGFMKKSVAAEDPAAVERARKAWTFVVTPEASRFAHAIGGSSGLLDRHWPWKTFAHAVGASGIAGPITSRSANEEEALGLFLEAFEIVRRPVGHTPFEAAAILAMIRGFSHGLVLEIEFLHKLMLNVKREGGLGGRVSFAAGNDIDRMFLIVQRPASGRSTSQI